MFLPAIVNIAEICARKGIRDAVLSPGSRCAPLTLAFARHKKIRVRTVSDERSAGYIALGMAQSKRKPVVLVCTSGTAALNYAPAITEAFYQHIPLVVITADRPPEWVDQQDGQAIHQSNLYSPHIKAGYDLPVDTSHADAAWHMERSISEAVNCAQAMPAGPVHLNLPVREPLYPRGGETIRFGPDIKIIEEVSGTAVLDAEQWQRLVTEIQRVEKILLVGGQGRMDSDLLEALNQFCEAAHIPVVGDVITNLHPVGNCIKHADIILAQKNESVLNDLCPELLITFGLSTISKNLKMYLRKFKAKDHWHIQSGGQTADTYQSVRQICRVNPGYFFRELAGKIQTKNNRSGYYRLWRKYEQEAVSGLNTFFRSTKEFSEFEVVRHLLSRLPAHSVLHLGNSLPVRYANYVGIDDPAIEVFSNRGTAGIDGTLSTAVGHAISADKINTLILGDMAFIYDRNAFWNNYIPSNLRIVVLNNHGGGIFKLIDGPGHQPEVEELFVTKQPLTAEMTAKEYGFNYFPVHSRDELLHDLDVFFDAEGPAKILEVFTETDMNTTLFKQFINQVGQSS